jgi:hypothetical protein
MQIDIFACIFGAIVIVPVSYASLALSYRLYESTRGRFIRAWNIQKKWTKFRNGRNLANAHYNLYCVLENMPTETEDEKYIQHELRRTYRSFLKIERVLIDRMTIEKYKEEKENRDKVV